MILKRTLKASVALASLFFVGQAQAHDEDGPEHQHRPQAPAAQRTPPPAHNGSAQRPPPPAHPGSAHGPERQRRAANHPAHYPPPRHHYRPSAAAIHDWQEGDPIPPGYTEVTRVNTGLIVSGATTLGLAWLASVMAGGIGAELEDNQNDLDRVSPGDWSALYVPVAGPFIAINTLSSEDFGTAVLVIDGVVQSLGLISLVTGIVTRKHKLVPTYEHANVRVQLTPWASASHQGFGLSGRF